MQNIQQILANISVELAEGGATITPEDLATFDLYNLHDQYQNDLQLFAFFTLLEKEARKLLRTKELEQDEREADLYSQIGATAEKKMTVDSIKKAILMDPEFRKQNREVVTIKNQIDTLVGIISVLTAKGIALNVLTARDKAELMSGLK